MMAIGPSWATRTRSVMLDPPDAGRLLPPRWRPPQRRTPRERPVEGRRGLDYNGGFSRICHSLPRTFRVRVGRTGSLAGGAAPGPRVGAGGAGRAWKDT